MAKSRTRSWRKRMRSNLEHRRKMKAGTGKPLPLAVRKKKSRQARAEVSVTYRQPVESLPIPVPASHRAPAVFEREISRAAVDSHKTSKPAIFQTLPAQEKTDEPRTLKELILHHLPNGGVVSYGSMKHDVSRSAHYSQTGYREAVRELESEKKIKLSQLGADGRLVSDALMHDIRQ